MCWLALNLGSLCWRLDTTPAFTLSNSQDQMGFISLREVGMFKFGVHRSTSTRCLFSFKNKQLKAFNDWAFYEHFPQCPCLKRLHTYFLVFENCGWQRKYNGKIHSKQYSLVLHSNYRGSTLCLCFHLLWSKEAVIALQ